MRFSTFSAAILLLPSFASSIAVSPSHEIPTINSDATFQILEKRRGGGGSGGRGGGSSGSGGRGGGSGASTGVRGGGTTS